MHEVFWIAQYSKIIRNFIFYAQSAVNFVAQFQNMFSFVLWI